MESTGNYYLISHLVLVTGLSDRTIRNHIAAGFLSGEKINGLWHFTPEQVERYVCHPAVRPGILAKNNGHIYDFLTQTHKRRPEACIILDIPDAERRAVAEHFCFAISHGDYQDIQFTYDGVGDVSRVIIKGPATPVLELVNAYFQKNGK